MASRMDKYYKNEEESNKRSVKNLDLYDNMYTTSEGINVDGLTNIDKTHEIDIDKLRELLRTHEKSRQSTPPIVKQTSTISREEEINEEKNYDIKDILSRAKSERSDDNEGNLKNTQYNILKNINLRQEINKPEYFNEEELNDLINTITNTSILNKLGDKELSLNMLDDLKSENTKTQVKMSPSVNDLLKDNQVVDPEPEMDKSFYTSSLNINKHDFENLNEIKTSIDQNNILIKILVVVILIVIVISVFVIYYNVR